MLQEQERAVVDPRQPGAEAPRKPSLSWELGFSNWALDELVEAAAHMAAAETAGEAYGRLAEMTQASGTDWALGTGAVACAADGEHRGRGPPPRGNRAPRSHPRPSRARPSAPGLRGVAAQ